MLIADVCATLRFSTAGMPEAMRARAVRDLHLHDRTILSAKLEPIKPLEPLPDCPLHVDLTKRTLPGLAVVSGTLSGLRHAVRPSGTAANGADDLLLGINVRGCSIARQHDRDLMLRAGDAFFATRGATGFTITRPTPVRFIGCRVRAQGHRAAGRPARRHADTPRSASHRTADPARHLCQRDCRGYATCYAGAATARSDTYA